MQGIESCFEERSFAGIRPHKPPVASGFPASVVSQLMPEFKAPQCHPMGKRPLNPYLSPLVV